MVIVMLIFGTGFNFSRAVLMLHIIVHLFQDDFYNSINSLSLNLSITVCIILCVCVEKVARYVSEAH